MVSLQDDILRAAVIVHDDKNWKQIALKLKGKTEVQCLHRWNVLDPLITKGPWTVEVTHNYILNDDIMFCLCFHLITKEVMTMGYNSKIIINYLFNHNIILLFTHESPL